MSALFHADHSNTLVSMSGFSCSQSSNIYFQCSICSLRCLRRVVTPSASQNNKDRVLCRRSLFFSSFYMQQTSQNSRALANISQQELTLISAESHSEITKIFKSVNSQVEAKNQAVTLYGMWPIFKNYHEENIFCHIFIKSQDSYKYWI